jgi:hypothetical protein
MVHEEEMRDDETMGKLANLSAETITLESAELQDRAWMISDLKVCALQTTVLRSLLTR